MKNENLDAVVSELRAAGIEPAVEYGGKHLKVRWSHEGESRQFTVPVTTSDRRSHMNSRSDVRAILRDDGLIGCEVNVIDLPRPFLRGGAVFCSSLDVARHFGKDHKNVLRSIDHISLETGKEFTALNFEPSEYQDATGRKIRCFDLSRDAFSLLVMGFTGSAALAWKIRYIDAFNKMEAELRSVAAAVAIPPDLAGRLEKIEGDLNALIDLTLGGPISEPGYVVVKAYRRRSRRAA